MRALTCPKALESPKRSMIRLASATSRRSARSAARRPLALLTRELRMTTQDKQRLGGDRVVLARSSERVDRSPWRERALQPLDRAGLSGDPAARVGERGRDDSPRQPGVARIVQIGPVAGLHDLAGDLAGERGGRIRGKPAQPVAVERGEPR